MLPRWATDPRLEALSLAALVIATACISHWDSNALGCADFNAFDMEREMRKVSGLLALVLVSSAPLPTQAPPDPFIWLEEVESAAASEWPRFRTERTLGRLTALPVYDSIRTALLQLAAPPSMPPVALGNLSIRGNSIDDCWRTSWTEASAPDTVEYIVLNHGRPAGEMHVATNGDSVQVRYHYNDRGRGRRHQILYVLGPNGSLRSLEQRALPDASDAAGPETDVDERFEVVGDTALWRSAVDSGSTAVDAPAYYQLRDDNPFGISLLANYLLHQPGHTATLLPFGSARAIVGVDTTLALDGARERLRFVRVEGVHDASGPMGVWLDERGTLVATEAEWFITVRRGHESVLPVLRAIEHAYHARAGELIARRLTPPGSSAVVIRNGDVFDSERGVMLPRTSVVIDGDRIVSVGPADSITIPAGARVIEATGKAVIPGLWDMHVHSFAVPEKGALHLAAGITTMRDLASDIDVAVSLRGRAAAGTVLSPRVLLAGFIEGPGALAGPSEALVSTEEEARRWVARYDSLGYRQIKVYNLVHPILIPTIAKEAKQRGMRLSGHVPLGISLQTAVRMGFDEVQHVPYLITTFFPDSIFLPSPRPTGVIVESVAQTFDLDAPRVTELLEFLRERGTVIDGTFNLFQHIPFRGPSLPDGTDAVFGPTLEWLPPLIRRAIQREPPPDPEQAARTEAARTLYRRLLKRLFDAGVTFVPGTDNVPGLSYHGELELYERAGIPPNAVLQIATIVPARVMGEEAHYGSIALGKVADLVIVDGQPAARIRDLRRAEFVVRAGRVYRTADLYEVAGLKPRW